VGSSERRMKGEVKCRLRASGPAKNGIKRRKKTGVLSKGCFAGAKWRSSVFICWSETIALVRVPPSFGIDRKEKGRALRFDRGNETFWGGGRKKKMW